jgi:RluA family pseudouridine synthase
MLFESVISPNDAGQRAERYLRKRLPNLGMSRLQSLFRRKEIKVFKRPIDQGHMLAPGDMLQVYGLRPEEMETAEKNANRERPAAEYPPLPVLFEDDEMIVVDKPAGVAAHPGTGIAEGASLIERVHAMLGTDSGWGGEVFSPALVHRLDKETSGVLLVAKTGPALRALTEALRSGRMRKKYLALVSGHPRPASGVIDAALARTDSAAGAKSRVAEVPDEGKHSVTRYKTMKTIGDSDGGFALLEVVIETGRMHQIRAHLAHIGHPIVGDTRYAENERPAEARAKMKTLGLKRMFLHAQELSWESPSGRRTFRAPLPEELGKAVLPR